jgi:Domain of unknown function (DUF5658)
VYQVPLSLEPLRAVLWGPRHRTARLCGLLAGIILLSFGDLYMTLLHLRGIGMAEANPLARSVMAYNSAAGLVAWKFCTVGLAVAILFYARRRRTAEFAAIFCCGVLLWLTFHWSTYNSHVSELTTELNWSASNPQDPAWVAIQPGS